MILLNVERAQCFGLTQKEYVTKNSKICLLGKVMKSKEII